VGELDDSFARLLDRQPTDKEKQALYRVRDALKLRATDSVWQLLMVLEHYETLYEKIPGLIADAAKDVTKTARATAEAQTRAAQEETKKALMHAVQAAAIASAKYGARAETIRRAAWMTAGLVLGALVIFLLAFKTGERKGSAAAADATRTQCGYVAAMAAWGNSAEGAIAHRLAEIGSLRTVASCDAPGWERSRDGMCVVRPYKGKTFGWRLPASN
jgi:hypothetical protein